MARGKKTTKKKPKPKPQRKKPAKQAKPRDAAVDAVSELVSVLACPKTVVNELALSCENVIEQMDVSCGFARFTSTAWAGRGASYDEIDAVARELIAEYERHAEALGRLLDRLAPLAEEGDHADHEDLDPMDVLARIQPMLVAEANA